VGYSISQYPLPGEAGPLNISEYRKWFAKHTEKNVITSSKNRYLKRKDLKGLSSP
jgi:hypothetical protein